MLLVAETLYIKKKKKILSQTKHGSDFPTACVLETLKQNPNITAAFSETHLLNMAVCLHSEVMHFGGCSDLMVLDSCWNGNG